MKLTLLGVWGPFPNGGGGCSSYLVEDGDTKILLDCGSGAMSRFRALYPGKQSVDAIVLSHMHADHAGEIHLFRYMHEAYRAAGVPFPTLPVLSPEAETLMYDVFDPIRTYDGFETKIGSLTLRFTEVRHAVRTTAVRVTDAAGHSLFYTADTGWFDGLVEAAKDADLLLADACFTVTPENPATNHMSGMQVGKLCELANCKRAVLTHRFGGGSDALPFCSGPCEYAVEGAIYEI